MLFTHINITNLKKSKAVREGFEPPRCDSVSNTLPAGMVVYPILLTYFVLITPETGGLVCQFQHLTIKNQ
jgi:hypothetical protein